MTQSFIITGTDTNIGKTVFSAALMGGLAQAEQNPFYWKPVQSGLDGMVDTRIVQKLSALDEAHFLEESYVLTEPLSPHRAAELDGVSIAPDALMLPEVDGPLILEGAGGLMVPLTRGNLLINQMKKWNLPVILVARTGLGTLNHTLLSLEALWSRDVKVHGIAFVGEENKDNIKTIAEFSNEKILGRLPILDDLNEASLAKAFADNFSIQDFIHV